MIKNLLFIPVLMFFYCCTPPDDAQSVVDKSMAYYGTEKLTDSKVNFTFRKYRFKTVQQKGRYTFERSYTDSANNRILEVLSDTGFYRKVNGNKTTLTEKDYNKYSEAVNATVYFAFIPLKLNDPSVIKKHLGEVTVNKKTYHKIEVSFKKDGGGKDYEDIFYYWFSTDNYSMDYLAYGSGGNRFRAAENQRTINGVKFQDYINYDLPTDSVTPLVKYDKLFEQGKLHKLSEIKLTDISVK